MLSCKPLSSMMLSSRLTSLSPIVPHLQSLEPCVHLYSKSSFQQYFRLNNSEERVATDGTEGCSGDLLYLQIERQAQANPLSTSALEQGAVCRSPSRKQGNVKAVIGLGRLQGRRGDLGFLGRDSHKEA